MRKFIKNGVIPFILVAILSIIGLEVASAQQYFTFIGKVGGLYQGSLSVKNDKGEVMNFAVGRRTVYIPSRLPAVGEKVEVTYFLRRGHNVGNQVKILPTK